MRFPIFFISAYLCCVLANAQQIEVIDANKVDLTIKSDILQMGNPGPQGKEIRVNNRYLTLGSRPIIPVMGEIHFSRIPREQWEDVILKMKACGINIIATYVLWIHHEELEGQYDWLGNKDLRAFAKLVAKHGLWLYPRIGPWCHAEVRNGGTPDWILTKTNLKDRSNDPVYQHYAEEWYKQVASQLHGLLYKDGGPVIGIQLENEYRYGKEGEEHILWLKKTALKYGLDVPLYTVTGWQNGSVPPCEVIPLWGAYPDEPWADHLDRNTDCSNFRFSPYRDSDRIGNDIKKNGEQYIDYSTYPYFTCEIGLGVMNSYHRRLQISPIDGLGLVIAKLGSGSNLPGYYMFAGGSNPHGILTSLEENKEETGYWNTYPVISYDFQAPIRESGALNGSYFEVKKLHYFLNEFGDRLAPMVPVFPREIRDFQYVFRTDKKSAYLFGMNYCRHNITPPKKNAQFGIKINGENIVFPSRPITICDSAMFIWPVNFEMDGITLKYATAQPLCHVGNKWIFIEDADSMPEFCFNSTFIESVTASKGKISEKNGCILISDLQPARDCEINIKMKNGVKQHVILLSKQEAKRVWLFYKGDQKYFFISNANLFLNGDQLHMFGMDDHFEMIQLNVDDEHSVLFSRNVYSVPRKKGVMDVRELKPLDDAQWLKTGVVDELNKKNVLLHRFFLKEFNVGNPSKVKKAQLIIAPQSTCKAQINSVWVNAEIKTDSVNVIDVTGYIQKGDNKLLLDFPFEAREKAFRAKLAVEYFNADRVSFCSDSSWIYRDSYNYPSYLTDFNGFKAPEILSFINSPIKGSLVAKGFTLILPDNYLEGLSNMYLNIDYTGDKGKLYFNGKLVADNFYDGTVWQIGLNRLSGELDNQSMFLELIPLDKEERVYFDEPSAKEAALKADLKNLSLIPEYQININLNNLLK
mgnify:CR=1 FL=1|jgi:hypothetical protein